MIDQLKNCVWDIEGRPELDLVIMNRLNAIGITTRDDRPYDADDNAKSITVDYFGCKKLILSRNTNASVESCISMDRKLRTLSDLYDIEPEKHTILIDEGEYIKIDEKVWKAIKELVK